MQLPCGHWLFGLEFRFRLELQDIADKHCGKLVVCVADARGDFFGVAPENVAEDPDARKGVQLLLDSMLRTPIGIKLRGDAMAVYRTDTLTDPDGAYAVSDTRLTWVDCPTGHCPGTPS
jgi:hypothetical protein